MTLANRFDQWATQYEQKGIEKDIEKGVAKSEALLLQRLLARPFGALPTEIVSRISAATSSELERWGDRALDAVTLDAIFLD